MYPGIAPGRHIGNLPGRLDLSLFATLVTLLSVGSVWWPGLTVSKIPYSSIVSIVDEMGYHHYSPAGCRDFNRGTSYRDFVGMVDFPPYTPPPGSVKTVAPGEQQISTKPRIKCRISCGLRSDAPPIDFRHVAAFDRRYFG